MKGIGLKKRIGIIIGVFVIIIIMIGLIKMREEIPYEFEVAPGDGYIWVINVTDWADNDCMVSITIDGEKEKTIILPGSIKAAKIDGLINGKQYDLSISRKDFLGKLKYKAKKYKATSSNAIKKYVVLIGASVGKSWDLNNLSYRTKNASVCFGYRGLSEFDKTPLIENIIDSPVKPDVVIIKECAAYFPRDEEQGVNKVILWIEKLKQAGIQPILATVVPVTKERDKLNQKKNVMDSINKFNGSIRSLGASMQIPVLDLQEILTTDSLKGFLDSKYAAPDGLHLNNEAYEMLDGFLLNFIK
jgi:hypothetical protein